VLKCLCMEPKKETDKPESAEDSIAEMELPQVEQAVTSNHPNPHKRLLIIIAVLILLAAAAATAYFLLKNSPKPSVTSSAASTGAQAAKSDNTVVQGLQLDTQKNYGNKYSNGILPVGDNLYTTDAAKQGYIYACSGYAANLKTSAGGAGRRGPWFIGTTQYDLNKKLHVSGAITWQNADHLMTVKDITRTFTTNDLPLGHTTGVFPIASSDPAYAYDRNPNSIKAQNYTYNLNADPTYGSPNCIGGQVGIMFTGVALFSGFDAAGRDAGAWEAQDSCDGHPESTGAYHYHTLSSCIKDTKVRDIIGFALDGFPITGPKVGDNNFLTTADLDECHGLTSQIILDGKTVTSYHYVMTQDFPYSVSCYRGTAIDPPGQTQRPTH